VRGWRTANVLQDEGLRTELRYLPSGGTEVFASIYQPAEPMLPFGVLVCPAWGYEALTHRDWQHRIAIGFARRGGVGVAFDYPGQGDSDGAADSARFDAFVRAATDTAAAIDGFEGRWIVSGVRLGAAVAACAARALEPAGLLFVAPELDPEAHFLGVLRQSRRATLNDPASAGLAFGIPVTDVVLASARAARDGVLAALDEARCPVAALDVTTGLQPSEPIPDGIETITVEGSKDDKSEERARVVEAALGWLDGLVRA
jgi:pimeloyl-ACP methyl ester carboxylesterase